MSWASVMQHEFKRVAKRDDIPPQTTEWRGARICDMEDRHLVNTLRLIKRKHLEAYTDCLASIEKHRIIRGAYDEEQYEDAMYNKLLLEQQGFMSIHKAYPCLMLEAVRRGIVA